MTDSNGPIHLNNHHRDTLRAIFQHPTSHNIDWKAVVSLLSAIGEVEELREGGVRVTLGGGEQVFSRPRHKDIDVQQVVDLRRILSAAGFAPVAREAMGNGKEV